MKVIFDNNRKFEQKILEFLAYRKKKIQFNSVSVSKIIKDVKKNGDKALLKYERRYNQNKTIVPSKKKNFKINKFIG